MTTQSEQDGCFSLETLLRIRLALECGIFKLVVLLTPTQDTRICELCSGGIWLTLRQDTRGSISEQGPFPTHECGEPLFRRSLQHRGGGPTFGPQPSKGFEGGGGGCNHFGQFHRQHSHNGFNFSWLSLVVGGSDVAARSPLLSDTTCCPLTWLWKAPNSAVSASNLDPAKILNSQPQTFQLKPDALASSLAFLQTMSINAKKAVEAWPDNRPWSVCVCARACVFVCVCVCRGWAFLTIWSTSRVSSHFFFGQLCV